MRLILRIDNFDYLPDGGPIEHAVEAAPGRPAEVGRDRAMDWTLPDPNRHISSRHFEVVWRDGTFWLHDLSTNGTFLVGQSRRLASPHPLSNGERLQVGQYIIAVRIEAAQPAAAGWGAAPAPGPGWTPAPLPAAPADPWSVGAAVPGDPPPGPVPMPAPPPARPADFAESFIDAPRPPAPAPGGPGGNGIGGGGDSPFGPGSGPGSGMAPGAPPPSEPFASPPAAAPVPHPAPHHAPASGPGGDPGAAALRAAICEGAGLPPGSLDRVDPVLLGREIGQCLRVATEELMALLGARAAAKQFVKSGSRTMIGGLNNSPLKFKPSPAEALRTMFVERPESFQNAVTAFGEGFGDIRRHQTAVYAAMQPALARLLEDLAPEAVEERVSGGLVTSKKARAWETYVERWDAKTHPYENGMLDVFLAYFAEAYDEAVKKTGGG